MQTNFTLAQLADPETARSEHILRKCVHCGFCTATCPTFVLLGDERDSPRGRIYFIKAMLEGDRAPTASEVTARRPLPVVPVLHDDLPVGRALHAPGRSRPASHRGALTGARCPIGCCAGCCLADAATGGCSAGPWCWAGSPSPWRRCCRRAAPIPAARPSCAACEAMLEAVPDRLAGPRRSIGRRPLPAAGLRRKRVALMPGCGQQVLAPEVNEATVRLLTRHDVEVVNVAGSGCCGSSVLHVGRNEEARRRSPSATSRPGCARSMAPVSTPSSSMPRAAAPR